MLLGKKPLLDCIEKKLKIDKVYVTTNNLKIINFLKENKINYIADDNFFSNIKTNHQGVAVYLHENKKFSSLDEFLENTKNDGGIILVIDSINDPQNFGAILRTCDAFSVSAVIYKKDNQVRINEHVIKTSMGAIGFLNLFKVVNLSAVIEKLKDSGYWVYASALNDKAIDYRNVDYDKKTVLIIGNENSGVSKLLLEKSDEIIKIPMFGHVQSLNVSVSTGIMLAEIRKKLK